jgi:intermembrane space import and assembly protein 40
MQDCFRQHPDIYGAELEDDEADYEGEEGASGAQVGSPEAAAAPAASASAPSPQPTPVAEKAIAPVAKREDPAPKSKTSKAEAATEQVKKDHTPLSESSELFPRAAHDAR